MMSDHGCRPTALAFMRACAAVEIQQAFTSDNNPKGNADAERVMCTLKEARLWLTEWTCPFALIKALEAWIADYNEHYLQSALGDKPPRQFERDYYTRHSTPFVAA